MTTAAANHPFEIWASAAVRHKKRTVADGRVSINQSTSNFRSQTNDFAADGDLRRIFPVSARFRISSGFSGWGFGVVFLRESPPVAVFPVVPIGKPPWSGHGLVSSDFSA